MSTDWLECDWCRSRFETSPLFYGCPACAAQGKARPLEMKYAAAHVRPGLAKGIWRWHEMLPSVPKERRVTLQEGCTPLLPIRIPGQAATVLLKNETIGPTWSWKDRPNTVSVSVARRFNFERVTARSTGNHGNAVAAYAGAGGMEATILCNEDTPALQLALMEGFGARVILGGCQEKILANLVSAKGYFPCTTLCPRFGYSNPFGVEGFKTIAFEIVEELGEAPDRVFIPAGSGDGIYGIWKGFREMAERGEIAKAPRIMACQPHGANSAACAWRHGMHHVEPLLKVETEALSVGELVTGDHALRAVYQSNGEFLEASEAQMIDAANSLQRRGFALELASALPYACAARYQAPAGEPETWILIGSGAAVKWPEAILKGYKRPNVLGRQVEEVPARDVVEVPTRDSVRPGSA